MEKNAFRDKGLDKSTRKNISLLLSLYLWYTKVKY